MSQAWQLRAVTPEDYDRILEIGQAEDIEYRGFTDFTREMLDDHILGDSSFDVQRDQIVADIDGGPVAVVFLTRRVTIVIIEPPHESRELREELLRWSERRQRELDRDLYRVGAFASNLPAVECYRAAGYELERVYAKMVRTFAETGPPTSPQLPAGYRLRPIDRDADAAALYQLNETAFSDRPDYTPETYEDFVRAHLTFGQYEPSWSWLVESDAGQIAGSVIGWRPPEYPHGYLAVLAVSAEHRRLGLGRALLLAAFAAIHEAGLPTAELHVASDNPNALGLYTGVEMVAGERIDNYARPR